VASIVNEFGRGGIGNQLIDAEKRFFRWNNGSRPSDLAAPFVGDSDPESLELDEAPGSF